jgi:hypothetical protein
MTLPNADYRFPPISAPPIEHELHRIESAAHLAMWQCPHCHAALEVLARDGSLPRALGVTHEKDCPDWLA